VFSVLDDKITRLKELKEQRASLGEQIEKLAAEIADEVSTAVKGNKKSRKPRSPRQLTLVT
jgi:hypothetical protein